MLRSMRLVIPDGVIKPDTGKEYGPCVSCLQTEGKWLVSVAESIDRWCAYCFLYETEWGRQHSDGIHDLVMKVETSLMRQITGPTGQLVMDECDRILSAIVLSSGYANHKK